MEGTTKKDPRRSISPDLIQNLCDNPKINFIDIQRGSNHDIDGVMRVGDRIHDFTDTVDIISQCDALVSTDTNGDACRGCSRGSYIPSIALFC